MSGYRIQPSHSLHPCPSGVRARVTFGLNCCGNSMKLECEKIINEKDIILKLQMYFGSVSLANGFSIELHRK